MSTYRKLAGLGCAFVTMVLVVSQAFGQSSPRTIYWDSVGQREWVPSSESAQFVFMGVDPANVIIRHEEHDSQGYFLIAEPRPWGRDTSTFERGRAYCIPSDGTAPQLATSVDSSRRRTIVFTRIGQREFVKVSECINVEYPKPFDSAHYIAWEPADSGYYATLSDRNQMMVVTFTELCQRHIVQSPAMTVIRVAYPVRYEQVIWTPRRDGWEVRLGTTERGCASEAVKDLSNVRDPGYNPPVWEPGQKPK